MSRFVKYFLSLALSLSILPQFAFADEPSAGTVTDTVTQPAPAPSTQYPLTQWDRPSFLPRSAFEASVGFGFERESSEEKKTERLNGEIGFSYGFTDSFQVDLAYQESEFAFTKGETKFKAGKKIKLNARHRIWGNDFASIKVGVTMPVYLDGKMPVRDVALNMPLSLVPTDRMVFQLFHRDFLKFKWAGGDKYKFGFDVNLPLKVAGQIGDRVWVELATKLAKLEVAGEQGKGAKFTQYIGGPGTPVDLSVNVAVTNWFDIEPTIGLTDAYKPQESITAGLNFYFRGGWLNG